MRPTSEVPDLLLLPPLESLRFFEAAGRLQSFVRAAEEIGVTPAAVAHRVRTLENHLEVPLFDRQPRGIHLNRRGRTYLKAVQRILAEVHSASERQRREPRQVRIISVEAVAEKWLLPRLASFKAGHPGVAIELETNHRGVDPAGRDFDAWLAYAGETAAPRPVTRREDSLIEETLYEEDLLPVCSPALLAARGRPESPADLAGWPLLYDLGWDADWADWFIRQGQPPPDLSRASGFRLYSMLVEAAVHGMGVGHRTPDADRAGVGEQDAGPRPRWPGGGAGTVLPDHHGGLPAAAGGAGVPGMGPGRGQGGRPEIAGFFDRAPAVDPAHVEPAGDSVTMLRLTGRERRSPRLTVAAGSGGRHYGSSCSARSMARRMKWETEAYWESRWTRARMRASSAAGIRKA